jgi:hypothetical protein
MAPKVIEIRHAKVVVSGYHDFGTRRHATAVLNLFIAKQPMTKDQSSDCWLSHHAKNQLGATSFSLSLEKNIVEPTNFEIGIIPTTYHG